MSAPSTVALLGLGLIGGSLARDISARGHRVLGHDTAPDATRQALAEGVLSAVLDASLSGVRSADLVVVGAPVDQTGTLLRRLAPHLRSDAVVTDVGSTKGEVLRHAEEAGLGERFVGSHPLAGDHRSGWAATRTGLFEGATVFLCHGTRAGPEAVARVRELWRSVGGICSTVGAEEHDELMAWVSHLPQVASSAVAAAIAGSGHPPGRLGPGGRDVTRLAESSPAMWSAICRSNAPAISRAVRALSARLAGFEEALAAGDDEALQRFFRAARDWRA